MKKICVFFIVFGSIILMNHRSTAAPNLTSAELGVNFGFFYSNLSPHGEWIEVESGSHVWRPYHVQHWWRPYMLGRWMWTDYGWYWMSSEPFGWVTYHYGRWYYDDYYGWVWMPDDTWGPAWVEWRYDNEYIGWAPLSPYATFSASIGIHFTNHWVAPVRYWNFVHYNHFGRVHRYQDMVPENRTRRLVGATRSDRRYGMENDRIINHGVDRSIIEQRGRMRIQRIEVQEGRNQSGERLLRSGNDRAKDHIEIYRPSRDEMQRNVDRPQIRHGDRALSIDMNKIERKRTEPRITPDVRPDQDRKRIEQRQERKIQHQGQIRESKPRIPGQMQPNKQEMRRKLIQRHENRQNISPPSRQGHQQRIEKRNQNRRGASLNSTTPEERSVRKREH